jgi:hypothetical protein
MSSNRGEPRKKRRRLTESAEEKRAAELAAFKKLLVEYPDEMLSATDVESSRLHIRRMQHLNDTFLEQDRAAVKKLTHELNGLFDKKDLMTNDLEVLIERQEAEEIAVEQARAALKAAEEAMAAHKQNTQDVVMATSPLREIVLRECDKYPNGTVAKVAVSSAGVLLLSADNTILVRIAETAPLIAAHIAGFDSIRRQITDCQARLDAAVQAEQTTTTRVAELDEALADVQDEIDTREQELDEAKYDKKSSIAEKKWAEDDIASACSPHVYAYRSPVLSDMLRKLRHDADCRQLLADAYFEASGRIPHAFSGMYPAVFVDRVINDNPLVPRSQVPNDACSICYDALLGNDHEEKRLVKSTCQHFFHADCIDRLFSNDRDNYNVLFNEESVTAECPMCRANLVNTELQLVADTRPRDFRSPPM